MHNKVSVIPDKLKCVIFDMDGVLYDSMGNHAHTWVKSFKQQGLDLPPEEAFLNEGRTGFGMIAYVFNTYLKKEASKQDQESIYNEKTRLMALRPKAEICEGIPAFISYLTELGIDIWVVTGSKQPTLVDKLGQDFGIASHKIVTAKDVRNGKPDPEPYLIALSKSGFGADECVVVENAPLGVRSTKAAGINTIAVNTGILDDSVLSNEGADVVLSGTRALLPLFLEAATVRK